MAWAEAGADSVHWRLLAYTGADSNVSEIRVMDLRDWGPGGRPVTLQYLQLNLDRFLLLRVRVEPSVYDHDSTRSFWDMVYSLKDNQLVWRKDHVYIPKKERPRLTPLTIGQDRVYFAHRTSNHGYDLVAFKLRTAERLYQMPLISKIASGDKGYLVPYQRDILDLIHLDGGDELIIQFNSDRLVSWGPGLPETFSIINGANGQVIQKIDCAGLGRPRIAKSTSTSFILASEVSSAPKPYHHCLDVVTLQTFSRQPNGSFFRTAIRVVTLEARAAYAAAVAIHPLTLRAFSFVAGNHAPQALTLVPNWDPNDRRRMRKWWPHLTVDEFYRVEVARPVTLPPRQRGRRKFKVTAQWKFASLILLDERRVVFDIIGSKYDALYLLDFTPEWW
ncbi:uncharacterized protein Z518_10521 [Rhinocladiella mackenziei CBS 650.93]|uniref:Rhinocladiella mackenziei CBS 650.93 unplaced genomic scaffold supercont1.9, whole genome shotgun sequence n=1 Tax=Rhinocladiella mackenziei CBS 650.93 TaxID=1442369 RepID=A0A0D2FE89_9EURO|nr:uncharacterized protein Z518_10521 [Rhinocladiella mackenziei CBS 650.93]KIX00382.1 hypothetical protein Z518_10521 [Rhinocladiella mackenziei CBS 650.93]